MTETFEDRKPIVVGKAAEWGRQTAADVVAGGGSAVIVGRNQERVDETMMTLSANGRAWGITTDPPHRDQVGQVQQQLTAEHADAPCWSTPPASSSRRRSSTTTAPPTTPTWN